MTNEDAKKRLEVWLICCECPEDKQCYDSYLHSTCEYTDYCDDVSLTDAVKTAIAALSENKGEWIFDGFCGEFGYDDRCKCHCSNCNKEIIVDGVYVVGKGYSIPDGRTPNFCSNCGRDMRGINV